jgi:hypothetical protein
MKTKPSLAELTKLDAEAEGLPAIIPEMDALNRCVWSYVGALKHVMRHAVFAGDLPPGLIKAEPAGCRKSLVWVAPLSAHGAVS